MHSEYERIVSFIPNASLFLITPLLYCSEAAMRLNIGKSNLIKDDKLRDCFCGLFTKSADSYDDDKIYVLARDFDEDDYRFIFSLMENPLYVRHYRVFINNLSYIIIVYNRSDLIQDVIDILDEKPLTCLPQGVQNLIKYYWHNHADINAVFNENGSMAKMYSTRTDIVPLPKPYEFYDGMEWVGDKKYFERSTKRWRY